MDSALAWIGQIAEWLGRFFPRWVVLDTTEGMIKFVRGSRIVVCDPGGVYWWWPATTTVTQYPMARQAETLQTQTIVTTDDKTIIVGGMIIYSVHDLKALITTTFNAETTIKDIALTAVHDVCCQMSWDELKAEQRKSTLDTKLKNAAQKALKDYGVTVIKVMLVDLAPSRVVRLSLGESNASLRNAFTISG